MKYWRNNWEKFVSKKLQNASANPSDSIWDKIEQELDAQDALRNKKYYKTAAALAILLLISGASWYLTNTPTGQTAQFNKSIYLTSSPVQLFEQNTLTIADVSQSNELIAKVSNQLDKSSTQSAAQLIASHNIVDVNRRKVIENVSTVNVKSNHSIKDPLNYQTASLTKQKARLIANHSKLSSHDLLMVSNLRKSLSSQKLTIISISQEANFITSSIDLMENTDALAILSRRLELTKLYKGEEVLSNGLILQNNMLNRLTAEMQNAKLAKAESKLSNQSVSASESLAYPADILARQSNYTTDQTTALTEKELTETKSWLAEAMDEFNDWKEETEQASDEEATTEDLALVEEAVLDEEDPLTQLTNQTKDLVYAKNINKGFHIGIITGVQNTWVEKASRQNEISRDQVNFKFSPGYQIGINFGYDITNHFGLMAEVKYSDEGSNYFNEAKNRTEQLDLKYIELPVYLKFKHSKLSSKHRPLVFNYLIGVNYSDLRSVNASINKLDGDEDIDQRFAQDYNTSEWGISAGFDFDVYNNSNFFWTFGARAGVSGLSKSFPRFKGDGVGVLNYNVGVFTRFNFRKAGR